MSSSRVVDLTRSIDDPVFDIEDEGDVRALLRGLVSFYIVMEEIFFTLAFR